LIATDSHLGVNRWRPGSPKWFTVLHQAAWHGAPASLVLSELMKQAPCGPCATQRAGRRKMSPRL
jgi:hypothetical protein